MSLTDILTLLQTIAILVALGFTAWQISLQRKEMGDEAYRNIENDYRQIESLFADNSNVDQIFIDLGLYPKSYTDIEKFQYGYLQMQYELLERIYVLYDEKKIDEETWKNWDSWLKYLSKHPVFVDVHNTSKDMFYDKFHNYVQDVIVYNKREENKIPVTPPMKRRVI